MKVEFAHAQHTNHNSRILLLNAPSELSAATYAVLEPWNIQIEERVTNGISLPNTQSALVQDAIASGVRAVILFIPTPDGASLWLYDCRENRSSTRSLPLSLPLDAPTAASVALSIKTLLQLNRVAPQIGQTAPKPRFAATQPLSARTKTWRVELTSLLRSRVPLSDFRFAIALTKQFAPRYQLGVHLQFGPGKDIESNMFQGLHTDTVLGTNLRYWLRHEHWRFAGSLATEVHFTTIQGAPAQSRSIVKDSRINPVLGAGLLAERKLTAALSLGFDMHFKSYLKQQRYLAQGTPILTLPSSEIEVGAYVALAIH